MAYTIPLFDLNYGEEECEAVVKTLKSRWISMGPNVRSFEENFDRHLGVQHSVAVSSCTSALHLALKILGVSEGDEVIVPALTFVATVNAVRYVGATPVFADITSHEDFSIDPEDIRRKCSDRTKVIIPMHYAGFACDMCSIMSIAEDHGLYVVEDAAHAPDSEYRGKKLGTFGDFGCFSLFSNKNITCGEGGVLVAKDENHAKTARLLRSHGMTALSYDRAKGHATSYDVLEVGFNYRLDDIRGALALVQLEKLGANTERRRVLRNRYLRELEGVDDVYLPYRERTEKASNYIFPVVLKESDAVRRELVRARLAENGIETSVHYPAVHELSAYRTFDAHLPITEYIANNEVTLPLFEALRTDQVQDIVEALKAAL